MLAGRMPPTREAIRRHGENPTRTGTPRFSVVRPRHSSSGDLQAISAARAVASASGLSRSLRPIGGRYGRRRGSSAFSSRPARRARPDALRCSCYRRPVTLKCWAHGVPWSRPSLPTTPPGWTGSSPRIWMVRWGGSAPMIAVRGEDLALRPTAIRALRATAQVPGRVEETSRSPWRWAMRPSASVRRPSVRTCADRRRRSRCCRCWRSTRTRPSRDLPRSPTRPGAPGRRGPVVARVMGLAETRTDPRGGDACTGAGAGGR